MPVMDHLRELRRRLIYALLIIAVGAIVAYEFYNPILKFLEAPYCSVPRAERAPTADGKCALTYLGPATGFLTRLKISVMAGTVFTAPLWLYQVWAFVTPGLRKNERKYTIIFVAAATTLFLAGMALAYAVLYKGLQVLIHQAGSGTFATLEINQYVSFITLLMVAFGAAFELPLLIVMMNVAHVLPYRFLRKWQRLSIFLIFVFAGVATPTADPFTMCAMAVPMLILFELAVLFAFFNDRRRARRQAAEDAIAGHESLDDDVPSVIDPIPARLDDSSWSDMP